MVRNPIKLINVQTLNVRCNFLIDFSHCVIKINIENRFSGVPFRLTEMKSFFFLLSKADMYLGTDDGAVCTI